MKRLDFDQISRVSPHFCQRLLGAGVFVVGVTWIPASIVLYQTTIYHVVPILLIGLGLYDLYTNGFYAVVRPAVLITLGIGIQLVTMNVLSVRELLVLWPLSLIVFGLIVRTTTVLERHERAALSSR